MSSIFMDAFGSGRILCKALPRYASREPACILAGRAAIAGSPALWGKHPNSVRPTAAFRQPSPRSAFERGWQSLRRAPTAVSRLVILAPAGYATLGLVAHLDYRAACCEDTWIQDEKLAKKIATRIGASGLAGHYNRLTTRVNAQEFTQYLTDIAGKVCIPSSIVEEMTALDVRSDIQGINEKVKKYIATEEASDWWHQFTSHYAVGDECVGTVDGVAEFGVFVRFDEGPTGLIHISRLTPGVSANDFNKGDRVRVEILGIDRARERVSLHYLERAVE